MKALARSLLATAALLLAAPFAHAEPVRLDVLVQGDADPYRAVAEAFEKQHGDIHIEIGAPIPTYEELLQRTLRGVLVGDEPDVAFQGYNLVRQVVSGKAALDLTELAAGDADLKASGYDAGLSPLCQADGQQMGLPFAISLPILFVNADLVRKAGGDPDNLPADWDGIIALAARIHDMDPTLQGIHFRYAHSGNWSFQALVTAAGGRMMGDDDKTIAFDGPAGMAALSHLQAFVDRGGMVDMTSTQAQQAFGAGTVGIMSNSSSFLTGALKAAAGHFELRVMSYPLAPDVGRLPPGGNCVTIAARDPERQKAAWTFAKFAVGPEAQLILARQSGYVPVNSKAAVELIGRGDDPAEAVFRLPVGLLPRLTQWYGFPPPNGVKITAAIQSRLQSVVSKTATPEQAMQGMVADVSSLLAAGAK